MNLEDRARQDADELTSVVAGMPVVPFERVNRAAQRRRGAVSIGLAAAAVSVVVVLGATMPASSPDVADPSLPAPVTSTTMPDTSVTERSIPLQDPTPTSVDGAVTTALDSTCDAVRLLDVELWGSESADVTESVIALIENPASTTCDDVGAVAVDVPDVGGDEVDVPAIPPRSTIAVRWDVCSADTGTERRSGTVVFDDQVRSFDIQYRSAGCPVFGEPVSWLTPDRSTGDDLDDLRLALRTIAEAPTMEFVAEHPGLGFETIGAIDVSRRAFQVETTSQAGIRTGALVIDGVEYDLVDGSWSATGGRTDPTTFSWLDQALLGDWYTFGVALEYGQLTEVDRPTRTYRLELDADTFERATRGPDDTVERNVSITVGLDEEFGIGTVEITTTTPTDSSTSSIAISNRFGSVAIDEP